MDPFYGRIAEYYDDIFPLKNPKRKFILTYLDITPDDLVLDVGAATGALTLFLGELSKEVYGIEPEPNMLAIAKQRTNDNKVQFIAQDMRHLGGLPIFSYIVCLGNTLVHLTSIEAIKQSIVEMYNHLESGGSLVLQIVNYDRILNKRITKLPTIARRGLSFCRNYSFVENGNILFSTKLTLDNGESYEGFVELYPLKRAQLSNILESVGFASTKWFGSYMGEDWQAETSFHTIAVTYKN